MDSSRDTIFPWFNNKESVCTLCDKRLHSKTPSKLHRHALTERHTKACFATTGNRHRTFPHQPNNTNNIAAVNMTPKPNKVRNTGYKVPDHIAINLDHIHHSAGIVSNSIGVDVKDNGANDQQGAQDCSAQQPLCGKAPSHMSYQSQRPRWHSPRDVRNDVRIGVRIDGQGDEPDEVFEGDRNDLFDNIQGMWEGASEGSEDSGVEGPSDPSNNSLPPQSDNADDDEHPSSNEHPRMRGPKPIPDGEWSPYSSKESFLGAILLFNVLSPMSRQRCKLLWNWLNLLGVNMPTIGSIIYEHRRVGKAAGAGISTHSSVQGTAYDMADLQGLLRMEMANPEIARNLRRMLEINVGHCSQHYECDRWINGEDLQTQCVRVNGTLRYRGEYYLVGNRVFRVMKFAKTDGKEMFEWALAVKHTTTPNAFVLHKGQTGWESTASLSCAKWIKPNIVDLLGHDGDIEEEYKRTTNPHRQHGMMVVVLPIIFQADDMAGSRTKKWSAHFTW